MFKSIKKRLNRSSSSGISSSRLSSDDSSAHGKATSSQRSPRRKAKDRSGSRLSRVRTPTANRSTSDQGLATKVEYLGAFDACVEAADSLASSGPTASSARRDEGTGLLDCSVLVSPDGNLLLIPEGHQRQLYGKKALVRRDSSLSDLQAVVDEAAAVNGVEAESDSKRSSVFSELMEHDDYDSAIFLGNDLHPLGDKVLNGFSAKGWSTPATSLALQQTEQSLKTFTHFCEELISSKEDSVTRASVACDNLRSCNPAMGGTAPLSKYQQSQDWEIIDPRATDFEVTPQRVGPLLSNDSSLNVAMVALQHYLASSAEAEGKRLRAATTNQEGLLPLLHHATDQFSNRAAKRQQALDETSRRARLMEDRLRQLKRKAIQKWEAVYRAEDTVTKRVEAIMEERNRQRERKRLEQLLHDEQKQANDTASGVLGATNEEIWNIVSSVADSMEDGSFEPLDLPSAPLTNPRDQSMLKKNDSEEQPESFESQSSGNGSTDSIPLASREIIEQEVGLPDLRASAMAADEAVEDASGNLLNILCNLDTARRSARVAAETCLVSACNAQESCMRSLIALERASLEERLRHLADAEKAMEEINVRADLDAYITADKKDRGGSSHLGDDDDGGIASALAILSSHVDGNMGTDSVLKAVSTVSSKSGSEGDVTTPGMLDQAIEELFEDNALLQPSAPQSEEREKARSDFENSAEFLCTTASENTAVARARRSAMCYTLNSKRNTNVEILTPVQFEGLCRVFSAILTGCNSEEAGVSNAKMCMMLAQTFYMIEGDEEKEDKEDTGTLSEESPLRKSRNQRVYVKSRLINHPLWSKDGFWDEALRQQISESLTHSGVMSNFEKGRKVSRKTRRNREWTQLRKTKWHDLTYTERIEAASQVHAVVFAQLGALAHSMIEFGCGLERSCAFVRRMSIRNQLPSSQRTMLLQHLMDRDDVDKRDLDKTQALTKK